MAWRQLRKSKLHSTINVTGLAAGMAVALLIGIWVRYELTFDHYFRHHTRLMELLSVGSYNGTVTVEPFSSVPVAAVLRSGFSGDLKHVALVSDGGQALTVGTTRIGEWGWYAQAEFPEMFTLEMVRGRRDALKDPSALLLSQSVAKILFGDRDPMNQTVLAGDSGRTVLKVGGVYKDFPDNTTFAGVKFFIAWDNKNNAGTKDPDDWSDHHFQLFAELQDHAGLGAINRKIKDIAKPHIKGGYEELQLHPMDRWYLYDVPENGKMTAGRLQSVRLFGMIGLFVLLLACINFMNLSTAKSEKRARETGVRKTIGALRRQLVGQFLCESVLVALLASILALLLTQLLLPLFNDLAGKRLSIPYGEPLFWGALLGITLFTGLLSGSYPAFYLSGFQPVKVLKGAFRVGRQGSLPRRILVVLQFTISITLIIGTVFIYRQIHYAKDRPVGYTPAGLITISMDLPNLQERQESLRYALLQTGAVQEMALSSSPTTTIRNSMFGYDWEGRDPASVPIIGTFFVSYDFGKTVHWQIVEGRDFSRAYADSGGYILNEAAVRFTGLKDPLNKTIRWHGVEHPIIGVVRNMIMESPYQTVQPTFFTLQANTRIRYVMIRIKPMMAVRGALSKIEEVFKQFYPDSLFYYTFSDETYGLKFREEEHTANLATVFSVLAIFISCLGLFGLASFVAEQRTKEIGIRKVLGASVLQLWGLLSKEFVRLVSLSFLLAAPLARWYLYGWLHRYTYHTGLSWWVFVATGLGALLITFVTVSVQSVRAALTNPVTSLKAE